MKKSDAYSRWRSARQCGEKIAVRYGFKSLPVDPFAIAKQAKIEVLAKPESAEGVSGMLLRNGDDYGIMYATHIASEGFQRFSVAHELGHYFLEGHMDHVLPPGSQIHESRADFGSCNPYEVEADHFASGLLMPGDLFKRELGRLKDGLAGVESLAELCGTSLTATAIRYAECTPCAAAIIVSTGQNIDYCFLSETLREAKNIDWPKRGTPLPSDSLTITLNRDALKLAGAVRSRGKVEMSNWIGGVQAEGIEEVVYLGGYGKTLTILSCPDYPSEEEVEENERLEDSWTPRYHKRK